jgi:hypothetical protein
VAARIFVQINISVVLAPLIPHPTSATGGGGGGSGSASTPGETPAVESEGGISPDLRIFIPAKVEKNTVVQAYIKERSGAS